MSMETRAKGFSPDLSLKSKRKARSDSSSSKIRRIEEESAAKGEPQAWIARKNARIACMHYVPAEDWASLDENELCRRHEGKITIEQARTMLADVRSKRAKHEENTAFLADINPVWLLSSYTEDSPKLAALKNKNYINLAVLAIATYNKENSMGFEVQQVEKVEKVLIVPDSLSDIAYHLTFTATDVQAGGCDLTATCKTFQAYVVVDISGTCAEKKVESCLLKA